MKKVFLDCGGNIGQSVKRFKRSKRYTEDFIIHSWEPVEKLSKFYRDRKDITFHPEAVWTHDGEISFYLDISRGPRRSLGSTLFKEKKSRRLNRKNPVTVPCVDFGKWVKENLSEDDLIILKIDIEGAEYDVLEKMIEDGSIKYIDDLYIEWHYHKVKIPKERHDALLEKLEAIETLAILPEMNKAL
jgi:FkbM family methyltransferase